MCQQMYLPALRRQASSQASASPSLGRRHRRRAAPRCARYDLLGQLQLHPLILWLQLLENNKYCIVQGHTVHPMKCLHVDAVEIVLTE